MNYNSRNSIFDSDGERRGYATRSQDGVINFFSNDGKRLGYIAAPDSDNEDE